MHTLVGAILLLSWKHGQAESHCPATYSQSNFKLQGHLIKSYSVETSVLCTEKCAQTSACHSINFYSSLSQGICELNNANHLSNPESLVFSADYLYLNYITRAVPKCSNKLCSYPLVCRVDEDGQSYKCLTCEDTGLKEVLLFPRKSVEDKIEHEFQTDFQLTAFTVSVWVQPDQGTDTHTPISYGTPAQPDEISIYLTKTYTELGIAKTFVTSFPSVLDGNWHHLCATWQNSDGTYRLYIDGSQQGIDSSMHQNHIIQKGAFIIGQEQDSYKGGFVASQAFQGNLTSVNMWDRALSAQEVSALAQKCPTSEGNFLSWSTLKTKTSGDVKLMCSSQCG